MKIVNTKDMKLRPTYMLVYGPSGIGKTSLIKSLPQGETLLLDAESGIASIMNATGGYDMISMSRDDDGKMLQDKERIGRLDEFNALLMNPTTKAKYKYVFIDSLTEIGQVALKYMQTKHEGFKAWGEYTNKMVDLMKFYRDIGHYTVVFTALETLVGEDETKLSAYPNVGGKKAKEYLLPLFDQVFRMWLDPVSGERRFITRTTVKTQAKDRSGLLKELEPADLMATLTKIRGK